MTRDEAEAWLKGPCPGGPGHEQDGSDGCRWARHDCYACIRDALGAVAEKAPQAEFPGYVVVGEAEPKPGGKWPKVELSSCWAPKDLAADRDPRGNAHGSNDGARWCVSLTTGLVEVREGDRIVLIRPSGEGRG